MDCPLPLGDGQFHLVNCELWKLRLLQLKLDIVRGGNASQLAQKNYWNEAFDHHGPLEAVPFIISSRLALNSEPAFHSGYLSP